MIEELGIRDLGVIADATLPIGPGFTAVTGETGAGKTMVVTALGLLLGARADAAAVRSGAKQAWVEGRWYLPGQPVIEERVADAGGELDEGELLLGRSVSAEGRSRAVVGGRSAPVGLLTELADELVVVHGQADQQRLRSAVAQRDALDRFAGRDLHEVLEAYRSAFESWRDDARELDLLREAHDARRREADELREALDEVEAADPQPGEDDELQERADRLTNLEDLRLAAAQAHELVSAENPVDDQPDAIGLVEHARRHLERVAPYDASLSPVGEALANAGFLLADAAAELSSYVAGLDADGARELELVQERRARLAALIRRHGTTLDDVLTFRAQGGLRLLELDGDDERIGQLEASVSSAAAEVDRLASRLTELRTDAAARLGAAVTTELAALAMPDAQLHVTVEPAAEPTASGRDQVSILLRPHPGAEPRSVSRGASGGELSRVMLAIEVVIAGTDPVPTFVFDEVDAGVGGAAAIEIGRRLARLAERSQVIVVTHLAQVAAFANNHLSVVKGTDGQVTASSVRQLEGAEREAEMARLLSGLSDSEIGLAHARELLEIATGRAA
ncbi:DNA repair protein RecN [Agromyces aerolatus]|uniref:DNA repair protein RecN n=1 Tax=Agromyces sp. LY-1074 TaxID=3074080 RepID=UPI00285EB1DA|nr:MULTISPECIES: DNA repair protein RecN [unclassified Agromyces]MDR5701761.1 DNA repair protein RecN [Agromyces sp. LY-1074]MDR5708052.1 DNA repair protein RecN [Agromyces sp. LY-1358]